MGARCSLPLGEAGSCALCVVLIFISPRGRAGCGWHRWGGEGGTKVLFFSFHPLGEG